MADRHRLLSTHAPVGRDHDMMDRGRLPRIIGDRVHFPRQGIEMRVGAERAAQRAAEIVIGQRLQGFVEQYRRTSRFDQRPDLSRKPDHVGVDGVEFFIACARGGRLAKGGGDLIRANPAIAVPAHPAVFDVKTMDHAVAEEPLVGPWIGSDRVGADAHIAPIEGGRDRAGDRQVLDRHFFLHRRVNAGEERMGAVGRAHPRAIEGRERRHALADSAANRGFDDAGHWVFLPVGIRHRRTIYGSARLRNVRAAAAANAFRVGERCRYRANTDNPCARPVFDIDQLFT